MRVCVIYVFSYRKAPEHIYPAGLNDALKATKYFMRNARKFGVDATRIAIGGNILPLSVCDGPQHDISHCGVDMRL